MKLSVEGLNSYYGPAHILFDIALEVGDERRGAEATARMNRKPAVTISPTELAPKTLNGLDG